MTRGDEEDAGHYLFSNREHFDASYDLLLDIKRIAKDYSDVSGDLFIIGNKAKADGYCFSYFMTAIMDDLYEEHLREEDEKEAMEKMEMEFKSMSE